MEYNSNSNNQKFMDQIDKLNQMAGALVDGNAKAWAVAAVKCGVISPLEQSDLFRLVQIRNTMGHGGAGVIHITENEITEANHFIYVMNNSAQRIRAYLSSQGTQSAPTYRPSPYGKAPSTGVPQRREAPSVSTPQSPPTRTVRLKFDTPEDCLSAVTNYLTENTYRQILNRTIEFAIDHTDFKIIFDILYYIDTSRKYVASLKNNMALYFIQKVHCDITENGCYKTGMFSSKLKFRKSQSREGKEARENKFLEKFCDIALKYDKEFVKKHYYTEY